MADRIVTIDVRTQGLVEAERTARQANTELDKLERRRNAGSSGSTSRAASAALSASGGQSTGIGRGTAAGNSRGSGRDFARQAQGMGGLVQLYATFAANIFAVSTAFSMLSRSMDFKLMETGARQLSVTLGMSLNSVARSIQATTDGAVSLKDALGSAALASSAGLSTQQIGKLAKAAKHASIVMGRDMTDALNRMFRGVAKVEPELLDELGIMVKVNDANTKYAKSIGKTVSALTDFERRQAFANAAITKSEQIYSSLENGEKIVNSFSQATASLTNALLSLGSTIGTGISPLLSALASSPTALYAGIAALVGLLLKTAIPAFKDLGAARLKALEMEQSSYTKQIRNLEKFITEKRATMAKASEAEIAGHRASIAKVADLFGKDTKAHASLSSLIGLNPAEIDKTVKDFYNKLGSEIKRQNTKLAKLQTALTTVQGGGSFVFDARTTFQPSDVQRLTDSIAHLTTKLKGLGEAQVEVAGTSSRMAQIANAANTAVAGMELAAADKELDKAIAGKESLKKRIDQVRIRSQAVEISEAGAPLAGWKFLSDKVDELNVSGFSKAAQKTVGAFNILTAAVGGLVSKLTLWVGVYAVVSSLLKAFTDWMKWTNAALDVAAEKFTTAKESTEAFSTALVELGRSLDISEYVNRNVAAISLQAQALESYLSGVAQYKATMEKTGSEGSLSRWWERSSPWGGVSTSSVEAFQGITSKLTDSQKTSLEAFTTKARPTNTRFNTDEYQEYLINLIRKADSSTPQGKALREEATKELNALHAELDSIGISSLKMTEKLKLIASVEKVVSDNATDFIASLAFQSKEFTSANNIFTGLANTAGVLAKAGNNSREGVTALTASLNTLGSSTTRVYAGLSAATIASLDSIQTEVDKITNSKASDDDKQKKLKTLFSKPENTATIFKANMEAANNLVKLALADSNAKIASSGINTSLKRMGAVTSILGTSDSPIIKKQEQAFQDKLIKIQLESLNVQQTMLKATNKLDKDKFTAAINFAKNEGVTQALLNKLFGTGTIKAQGLLPGASNDPAPTEAQKAAANTLVQASLNNISSEAGSKVAQSAIKASIATLSSELSSDLAKELQKLKNIFDEDEKTAEFKRKESATYLARGLADWEAKSIGFGFEALTSSIYKLEDGNEALSDALAKQASGAREIKLQEDSLDKLTKELAIFKEAPAEGANPKYDELISVRESTIKRLEELKADKKLKDITVVTERTKESFEVLNTELTFVSTTLGTFSNGLSKSASMLNELTTILVDRSESLGKASSLMELSKKVEKTQFEYETLKYEQAKKKLNEFARHIDSLAITPEQRQAEIDRINAELFSLAIEQRSKEFEYLKAELAHDIKMREIRMKQAESAGAFFSTSKDSFWGSQNWKDASAVFFTSLDDITGNITSSLSQFARGMADVLDKSVDLIMDSWRKGKLTKKEIIPALGNIASDMLAQMASNSMKQALYGGLKSLTTHMFGKDFGKSDQDMQREKAEELAAKLALDTNIAITAMPPLLGKLDNTLDRLIEFLKGDKPSAATAAAATEASINTATAGRKARASAVEKDNNYRRGEELAKPWFEEQVAAEAAREQRNMYLAASIEQIMQARDIAAEDRATANDNRTWDLEVAEEAAAAAAAKRLETYSNFQSDSTNAMAEVSAIEAAEAAALAIQQALEANNAVFNKEEITQNVAIEEEFKTRLNNIFKEEEAAVYRRGEDDAKPWFKEEAASASAAKALAEAKRIEEETLRYMKEAGVQTNKVPPQPSIVPTALPPIDPALNKNWDAWKKGVPSDELHMSLEDIGATHLGNKLTELVKNTTGLLRVKDLEGNTQYYKAPPEMIGKGPFGSWPTKNGGSAQYTVEPDPENEGMHIFRGFDLLEKESKFDRDQFYQEEPTRYASTNQSTSDRIMVAARNTPNTRIDGLLDTSDKDILQATQRAAKLAQESAAKAEALTTKVLEAAQALGKKYDELMKVMGNIKDKDLTRPFGLKALNDGVPVPEAKLVATYTPEINTPEKGLVAANQAANSAKNSVAVLDDTLRYLNVLTTGLDNTLAEYKLIAQDPPRMQPIPLDDGMLLWQMQQRKQNSYGANLKQANLEPQILEADKQELKVSYDLTEKLGQLSLAASNATTALGNIAGSTPGMTTGTATTTAPTAPAGQYNAGQGLQDGFASMGSNAITSLIGRPQTNDITTNTFFNAGMAAASSTMYDFFRTFSFSALGNIVGPAGIMPLHKFATGGIATGPQLAMFGEGSGNEAFVPLPDNRTIPVTLTGANNSGITMGDTSISVNVSVQKDGTTDVKTDAKMATEMGKAMSASVKQTVQEELIKQRRPGGLLYR